MYTASADPEIKQSSNGQTPTNTDQAYHDNVVNGRLPSTADPGLNSSSF